MIQTAEDSTRPGSQPHYGSRACPSCQSDDADAFKGIASNPAAETRPFAELQQNWYGFFAKKIFFSYRRCKSCGILYAPKYFTEEQLVELYSSMPANMVEVSDGALVETQRGYFNEFRKHSNLKGDFLEIGPDTGLFLENCVQEGSFSKYWMFEPNIATHDSLRARLGSTPHHISTELLDLSAIPDGRIDAAAMVHVVDHLLDPLAFLRELHGKLSADGIVLMVTHDESSTLAKLVGSRWPAYCLQHPQLFNPTSIRALLTGAGYETIKTVRSVNHFPVHFLIQHGILALGLGKVNVPRIDWLRVPLRLGNFITIAKRG